MEFSSGCIVRVAVPAQESDWSCAGKSFSALANASGLSPKAQTAGLPAALPYPESRPDPELSGKVRVLIAEDNPGDVYLVREALENHGLDAELSVQQDGEAMMGQIQLLEAGKIPCPDIILLDLNLPKYSGATLLERLRRSQVCSAIPVIIVTSSDSEEDRDMAAKHRARAYFRKPLDFDEFLKLGGIVKQVMQQPI